MLFDMQLCVLAHRYSITDEVVGCGLDFFETKLLVRSRYNEIELIKREAVSKLTAKYTELFRI